MRVKIKIKNKLEENNLFLISGLNWKENETLTKQKNQKNDNQIENQ
jgi:hypothetical protein